jgi:serine/threonine protein kinase
MDNELYVLETTSHPNIVNTIELLHDDRFYFIVTEFIRHGELYDFICQKGSITESEVRHLIRQLFLAINYLHTEDIVHRDIKPENILIEDLESLSIKLTDFGFATCLN